MLTHKRHSIISMMKILILRSRTHWLLLAVNVGLFAACCQPNILSAESTDPASIPPVPSNLQPYEYFLCMSGEKLGCYFTIEASTDPKSCFNGLELRDEPVQSVGELIAKLNREIPGAAVIKDVNNRRIFHLVERMLLTDKRYAMERRVSINFSGKMNELADALGKVTPDIKTKSGGTNLDFFDDDVTTVCLRTKCLTVRQTLTVAVPLKQYPPILWKAMSSEQDGKLGTEIQFYGPKMPDN